MRIKFSHYLLLKIIFRAFFVVGAFAFLLHGSTAYANDCSAQATGNWNSAGTWTGCGGVTPTASDNVTIGSPYTVTISATGATVLSVTIDSGGALTFGGTYTLTVSGDWTNNGGTFTPSTGTVAFNGSSAQTIKTNDQAFRNVTLTNNTINLTAAGGSLTMGGILVISEGKTPTITTNNQNLTVTSWTRGTGGGSAETLTIDAGTGAVAFNGTVELTRSATALTDLTITNSGALTFSSAMNLYGALTQTNPATGTTTFSGTSQKKVGSATLRGTTFNFSTDGGFFITYTGDLSITNSGLCTINAYIYALGVGIGNVSVSGDVSLGGIIITTNTNISIGGALTIPEGAAYGYLSTQYVAGAGNIQLAAVDGTAGGSAESFWFAAGTGTVSVSGNIGPNLDTLTATSSGGTTFSGTVAATTVTLTNTTGTIAFTGALTATTLNTAAQAYNVSFAGGATIIDAVTFSNTGSVTFGGGGTYTFTNGVTHTAGSNTINGNISTTNSAINLNNTTSVTGNSQLNAGSQNITLGAVTLSDGVTLTLGTGGSGAVTLTSITGTAGGTSSHVTFNVTGAMSCGAIGTDIGTLTLNASGATFTAGDTISVTDIVITAGTFDINTRSVSATTLTLTSGTISGTSGTITVSSTYTVQSGTISAILAGAASLTKTTAGTVTLSGANTYTGATAVNAGVLVVAHNTALGTTAGSTSVASGAEIDISGSGLSIAEPLNTLIGTGVSSAGALRNLANNNEWTGAITLGAGGATINSDSGTLTISTGGITGATLPLTIGGAGDTTISAVIGTTSGTLTKDGAGTLTLSAANTFTGGVTLNAGTLNINNSQALGTVAGTFTIAGGTINNTTAGSITTLNYPMNWNADFTFTGTQDLNLGAGAVTLSASRQVTANANNLIIGGTISAASYNLTKAGNGTLTLNGTVTINNLTISAGTLATASATFNIAGNWTNNGATFTPGSGTVTFNGTTQTVSGSTTFNNLTIDKTNSPTISFTSGTTQTIDGVFTATGDATHQITIGATSASTAALSKTSGTVSVSYSTISYSAATGGAVWQALLLNGNIDGGNNSGWIFASVPTLTTSAPTSVATSTMTLNANLSATGGADATQHGFAWGTNSTLSSGSDVATTTGGAFSGTGNFTSTSARNLSGLTPGIEYFFRAYAVNSAGTGYGSITSTSTIAVVVPTVSASAASSILTTAAILNGSIDNIGGDTVTDRGFEWGVSASYGTTITTSGSYGTGAFISNLTGLTCNTAYHFRSFATNSAGTGTSADATFTTSACGGGGGLPPGAYSSPAPPSGGEFSILIQNGAGYTNSRTVILKLNGGADAKSMAISNSADFYAVGQEPYQTTKTWTLADNDGLKTIYIRFYTQTGQPSPVVSDTIMLDTKPPEIKITGSKDYYSSAEEVILIGQTEAKAEIILAWDKKYGLIHADEQGNLTMNLGKLSTGEYQLNLTPTDLAGNRGESLMVNLIIRPAAAGPEMAPAATPKKTIIEKVPEIIKSLIPEFLKPKAEVKKPEAMIIIPEATPLAMRGRWNLLPEKSIKTFVLAPLPAAIRKLAEKFPELGATLKKIGITKITDLEKLQAVKLTLPGLTARAGLPTAEIQPGRFALPKNIPVAELSPPAKQQIPTEIIFARTGGQLIDFNMALSVTAEGEPQQKISTISGKPLQLVVKPDQPVKSVRGYVVFKSKKPRPASFQLPVHQLVASLIFANPVFAQPQEQPVRVEEKLVLLEFEYTDSDGDGIYTAEIQAPIADGEYEIITVMDFIDPELGKKEIHLITVVDPEGYIYEKDGDREIRIPGAIVSIFWLNPETKQYELWPAKEYQQENPQVTDVRGTYSFLVPEGIYYLKTEAPGYLAYESKAVEVREGSGVHINIELKTKYWFLNVFDWKTLLLIAVILLLLYNFYKDKMREKLMRKS